MIAFSDMKVGTGYDEINLPVDPQLYGGDSEFDLFYNNKDVQVSLKDMIAAMKKNGMDANDLSLLMKYTGGDVSQMNHLMDAILLSDKVDGIGVNAEWLYGLFRRGLPTSVSQLMNVTREKFDAALNDAVDLKIISNNVFAEADTIYNQITTCHITTNILSSPDDPEEESMLGYILSCAGIARDVQVTLYLDYLNAEKKDESFWAKEFEKKLITAEQQVTIPLYLKFAFVCAYERGIYQTLLDRNLSNIYSLQSFGYSDWFDIVQEARAKNRIPDIHPDEDAQLISKILNNGYKLIPTAVLLYLVKQEQVIRDNAWYYIEDNIFDFDFKDQNINVYMDEHPQTLEKYKNDIESLRRSLNRIQRTFLLTPESYRPVLTKALLDLNFDAANKILRIGEVTFVKYYREGLQLDHLSDSEKEKHASLVFQRARKQANLIRHLHSTYGTSFNNLPMYAVQQNDDRRKARV
ncbi:MAG TPA: hypothetical protein VFJ43_08645, partial [Bacteroidia bacterium]|nr:hypothetical protein [Bacteroidia bacterium]